ncbi:MAG TPA: hypothetical protein VFJ89_08470 [Nocardioides sp.]|jgi:hypothetical protein|nr:hypothetical protein [Nocardioides sp.]
MTARAVLAGLCAVVLTGCGGGSDGAPCTAIGAASGVTFWYVDVVGRHPPAGVSAKACVGSTCRQLVIRRTRPVPMLQVPLDGADGSPRMASLTVTDRAGHRVFAGRTTARPALFEPNGHDCAPHAWVARLDASGRHRLRQVATPQG